MNTTSMPGCSKQTQDILTPSSEQHEDCSKPLKLVKASNEMLDS